MCVRVRVRVCVSVRERESEFTRNVRIFLNLTSTYLFLLRSASTGFEFWAPNTFSFDEILLIEKFKILHLCGQCFLKYFLS